METENKPEAETYEYGDPISDFINKSKNKIFERFGKERVIRICITLSIIASSTIENDEPVKTLAGLLYYATYMYLNRGYETIFGQRDYGNFVELFAVCLIPDSWCIHALWKSMIGSAIKQEYEKVQVYTEHNYWGVVNWFSLNIMSNHLDIEYVGEPDFNNVVDEFTACEETKELAEMENRIQWRDLCIMWCVFLFLTLSMAGETGLAFGVIVCVGITIGHYKGRGENKQSRTQAIEHSGQYVNYIRRPTGVYRIYNEVLGFKLPQGMGYIDNGTFYTRYHVTRGNVLRVKDNEYIKPNIADKRKDMAIYGANHTFSNVNDGDEIYVALAGPYSDAITVYKSVMNVNESGVGIHLSMANIPGTSGSPIFKRNTLETVNEYGDTIQHTKYNIVGTTGWSYNKNLVDNVPDSSRVGIDGTYVHRGRNTDVLQIQDKAVTQYFAAPGSGKTHTVMPEAVLKGLAKYGRVIVTGPSLSVCSELYDSISKHEGLREQVSLQTSTAKSIQKGSSARPVIILAHAAALERLASGDHALVRRAFWVIDESHFMNSESQILKDMVRNKVKTSGGQLLEMTATGYDIKAQVWELRKGSNYPITDVKINAIDIRFQAVEQARSSKVLVFVPSIKGKYASCESFQRDCKRAGVEFLQLSRTTFDQNYLKTKEMEKGLIAATDICECGANISPEYVYDYQTTLKMIYRERTVTLEQRNIDKAQMIQRRGRTGRDRPGYYVSPQRILKEQDLQRAEYYDRKLAATAMGHDIEDPMPEDSYDIELSRAQCIIWLTNKLEIKSPYTIDLLYDKEGRPERAGRTQKIMDWLSMPVAGIRVGNATVYISFNDDRDEELLKAIIIASGIVRNSETPPSNSLLGLMYNKFMLGWNKEDTKHVKEKLIEKGIEGLEGDKKEKEEEAKHV